jgi:hypothetical protein
MREWQPRPYLGLGETFERQRENASITLSAERLKLFEGTYMLNPGFSLAVRPQGDHLSTEGQGWIVWLVGWLFGPVPMNPVSATRFSNDVVGAQIEFEPDADGQYRSLTLHQDGAVLKLRRQ